MADEITLYTGAGAAGLAVHWCLLEIGRPFRLVLIDLDAGEQHEPPYRAVNPTGRVPALKVGDQVYTESTALLMWLAEQFADKALAPLAGTPQRADYLKWMVWLANALMPAYRVWFYADGAEDDATRDTLRRNARHQVEACLDQLETHFADGRPFVTGDRFSVVDMQLTMLLRWSRNLPRPSQTWPNLRRYQNEMKARPCLREVHRREGLTDWIDDR